MKGDFKSFRKRIIGHQPKRKTKGNPPNCTSSVVMPIKISDDIFKRVLGISLRAHEIQTLERYYAIRASIEKDIRAEYEKNYTKVCHCSECAYNYALRNGLEFNKEDIICTYLASAGLTERDYCSQGKKLASISREELFKIMDFDEIEKFKKKENAKDGLSAKVTIIDELHSINDKESKDEV